jgi:hypothetical protein
MDFTPFMSLSLPFPRRFAQSRPERRANDDGLSFVPRARQVKRMDGGGEAARDPAANAAIA